MNKRLFLLAMIGAECAVMMNAANDTVPDVALGEVVVRTKVKFYFAQDTLVYNSDAFVTQHGLALNDLLQKMPGIEIDAHGSITVNGRKVDVLLVNGKDFFDKDRRTVIDNLPAFMVQNVKLYKRRRDSKSVISRERKMHGYVMDIRLRKGFDRPMTANADAGYGTHERYYTKLFGMTMDDNRRLSVYALSNNIGLNQMMDGVGTLHNQESGDGDTQSGTVGIDYNLDDPKGRFWLRGDASATCITANQQTATSSQVWLSGGDIFNRSIASLDDRRLTVKSNHQIGLLDNTAAAFLLTPYIAYERGRKHQNNNACEFDTDVEPLWGRNWKDSLALDMMTGAMFHHGINRTRQVSHLTDEEWRASIRLDKNHDTNHGSLTLNAEVGRGGSNSSDLTHMSITNRPQMSLMIDHRRNENRRHDDSEEMRLGYEHRIGKKNRLGVSYTMRRLHLRNDDCRFTLQQLSEWDRQGHVAASFIITDDELMQAFDTENSFGYSQTERNHCMNLSWRFSRICDEHETQLALKLPLAFERHSLDFSHFHADTTVTRSRRGRPDMSISCSQSITSDDGSFLSFGIDYEVRSRIPNLYNLIDFNDRTNALLLKRGNPDLKDARGHRCDANISYGSRRGYSESVIVSSSFLNRNEVAHKMKYDRRTGMRTMIPMNIDGSWEVAMTANNTIFVTKGRKATIASKLNLSVGDNADFASDDISDKDDRMEVRRLDAREELSCRWTTASTRLRGNAKGYMNYSRSTSTRIGFRTIETVTYGVNTDMTAELPQDILFHTDLITISRTGFALGSMNNCEVIWNASLSKKFGECFECRLECHDILNQFKSVYQYVNAVGRYSMARNNMRRYLMMHFALNLTRTPKKP